MRYGIVGGMRVMLDEYGEDGEKIAEWRKLEVETTLNTQHNLQTPTQPPHHQPKTLQVVAGDGQERGPGGVIRGDD